MRDLAKKMLQDKEVDVILGYTEGTLPLRSSPIVISNPDNIDQLIWNNLCYINLAKYLVPAIPQLKDKKVGVIAKGCLGRAVNILAMEKQLNLENIKLIGISCNGNINRSQILEKIGEKELLEVSMIGEDLVLKGKDFEEKLSYAENMNELCKTCKVKIPPSVDGVCVGECQEITSVYDEFEDVIEFEAKSADEKWKYIVDTLENCTRCYACREACPMCYCHLCFVDQNKPVWFYKTTDLPDIIVFHLIRALHMAGRCVGCGACSSVCPMGIDLNLINRKLEEIVKRRFDYTSGLSDQKVPPMMDFTMEDGQEFMLEED
jgi:coenzyme F420-reducing hydrogenase beta subunit